LEGSQWIVNANEKIFPVFTKGKEFTDLVPHDKVVWRCPMMSAIERLSFDIEYALAIEF
jgi:hypothetical protein